MQNNAKQFVGAENSSDAALNYQIVSYKMTMAALRLEALLCLRRFDPNQPRVPRGNADGGQWSDTGSSGGASQSDVRVAARRTRGPGSGRLTPVQRINHRQISVARQKINQINPREQHLEPTGGSFSNQALRSFTSRLKTLKTEAGEISFTISRGHGYAKHKTVPGFQATRSHTRFPDIQTHEQYSNRIYDTIVNGTHSRAGERGKVFYYNARNKSIVVVNPNARDKGTSFPAANGMQTYLNLD